MKSMMTTPPVAQAEVAGDLASGLAVDLGGGGLGVGVFTEASGVDVDGDQGLGLVEHQRPAGGQFQAARVNLLDLVLQAVFVEEAFLAGVAR